MFEDAKLDAISAASYAIGSVVVPWRRIVHKDSQVEANRHISSYLCPKYSEEDSVKIVVHTIDNVKVYQFIPKQTTDLNEVVRQQKSRRGQRKAAKNRERPKSAQNHGLTSTFDPVSAESSSSNLSSSNSVNATNSTNHDFDDILRKETGSSGTTTSSRSSSRSQPGRPTSALPTIFYYHGGAFSYYSVNKEYKNLIAKMAKYLNVQIFSPEYHLAPEHPFPRQFQDCYYTTNHILRNHQKYRVDLKNFSIAGDSAGGQLTCAITYKLSERNEFVPKLAAPLYPALQTVYVKNYPSQTGLNTKKKLLSTTSTTKAVLNMVGYDGFNQKYQKYMKRGYHLPLDCLIDQNFMQTISPKLWLNEEYGAANKINVGAIGSFQKNYLKIESLPDLDTIAVQEVEVELEENEPPSSSALAQCRPSSSSSKSRRHKLKKSEVSDFTQFTAKMRQLVHDPIFNIGCLSDEKLRHYISRGPKKFLFAIADCDPLRDEAIIFSNRLRHFQADCQFTVDKDMPHGYFSLSSLMGGFCRSYDRFVLDWLVKVSEYLHDGRPDPRIFDRSRRAASEPFEAEVVMVKQRSYQTDRGQVEDL